MMNLKNVLVILFLLYASCSSSIDMVYYSINQETKKKKESEPAISQVIAIENFKSTPFFRHNEIITREGKSQKVYISPNNLWWALPQDMVTEELKKVLKNMNIFRHVLSYPTTHNVRYVLEGNITNFEIITNEESEHWSTRVALEVYLVDKKKNIILWDSNIIKAEMKSSPKLEDASKKMGIAVRALCMKIGKELRSLLDKG